MKKSGLADSPFFTDPKPEVQVVTPRLRLFQRNQRLK